MHSKDREAFVSPWSYPYEHPTPPAAAGRPIVVGVDGSAAGATATRASIAWAARLRAPLVFVHVRRSARPGLGEPYLRRHLERETLAARKALDAAMAVAAKAGVDASEEVIDGQPARRLLEFARLRGARLLVVGHRRRRWGRSIARRVLRGADVPVLVST
jgi:nucleotide-binding universal stress UspA family protein